MAEREASWVDLVRRVVSELSASDVAEFEMAQRDFRLRLRRRVDLARFEPSARPDAQPVAPAGQAIPAPFTGIFYRSASPTAEPYVREGDWVPVGATVGLVETMKIFNEVKAEQAGRIERILVPGGSLVHAGDTLMTVVPGEPPIAENRL